MNASDRLPRLYALVVGSLDAATGALLVVAPREVLQLMWIRDVPAETVWLRFIGAFVCGVGLIYLYPLFLSPGRRGRLLPAALELSAIPRTCVGLFVTATVLAGALAPAWLSVAVTDLGLAALQVAWLARGRRAGVLP